MNLRGRIWHADSEIVWRIIWIVATFFDLWNKNSEVETRLWNFRRCSIFLDDQDVWVSAVNRMVIQILEQMLFFFARKQILSIWNLNTSTILSCMNLLKWFPLLLTKIYRVSSYTLSVCIHYYKFNIIIKIYKKAYDAFDKENDSLKSIK